jgi:hypothetical protein
MYAKARENVQYKIDELNVHNYGDNMLFFSCIFLQRNINNKLLINLKIVNDLLHATVISDLKEYNILVPIIFFLYFIFYVFKYKWHHLKSGGEDPIGANCSGFG